MCYHIVGMILVYLQLTASQKGIMIQQNPPEILLDPGQTARIDCKLSTRRKLMLWYKELPNGSLRDIYWSIENAVYNNEKYSSKVDISTNTHTLIIWNVQREDSAIYYCGLVTFKLSDFRTGTTLTVREEGIQMLQSPGELWLNSGETAQLNCSLSKQEWSVMWYREQGGNLQWIFLSSKNRASDGKYSAKANIAANHFSLIISNIQRNDSGVYYCGLSASLYPQPSFGNGTRVIVTEASEPRLSILAPSALEDAELPPVIPLLCLLSDCTPSWSMAWDTGEEMSQSQMDAGPIDGKDVFSVCSLTIIPSETWNQKTTYTCTGEESSPGRRINATLSKETGDCMIVLYAGLPCTGILLLIQLFLLLWRKCLIRGGRTVQRRNQTPMRQMPQTEYTTVKYKKRNTPL